MSDQTPFSICKPGSFNAATTAKPLPTTPPNGIPLVAGAFTGTLALNGRRQIRVTNEDATITIRVGDATIASGAGGQPIFARQTLYFLGGANDALWVVADSGTPLVSWLEEA